MYSFWQFDRDSENSGVETTIADKAVLYFNQALIHMRLHQYKHATFLLEQLFQVHNTLHSEFDCCTLMCLISFSYNVCIYMIP